MTFLFGTKGLFLGAILYIRMAMLVFTVFIPIASLYGILNALHLPIVDFFKVPNLKVVD